MFIIIGGRGEVDRCNGDSSDGRGFRMWCVECWGIV